MDSPSYDRLYPSARLVRRRRYVSVVHWVARHRWRRFVAPRSCEAAAIRYVHLLVWLDRFLGQDRHPIPSGGVTSVDRGGDLRVVLLAAVVGIAPTLAPMSRRVDELFGVGLDDVLRPRCYPDGGLLGADELAIVSGYPVLLLGSFTHEKSLAGVGKHRWPYLCMQCPSTRTFVCIWRGDSALMLARW